MQLQDDTQSHSEVKFQLGKDTLETMVKSMYCIRDQLSDLVSFALEIYVAFPYAYIMRCNFVCDYLFGFRCV